MKITNEVLVNFLIKFNKEKEYHKDYTELNLGKLQILNEVLRIDIQFTEDKKFSFGDSILDYHINKLLNQFNSYRGIIPEGSMVTNDTLELFHKEINTRLNDFALKKMNQGIKEIYKDSIKSAPRNHYRNKWRINTSVTESLANELNESLDDFCYF